MKKIIATLLGSVSIVLLMPLAAFAHVVVTPNTAGVSDRVLFTVGVPNEREAAVTSLKLSIPKGVTDVQPDVMAGWKITTTKNGDDVTAITWTGDIPVGQRADFEFKAQVPSTAGDVDWKAYQTYADGVVVSWDQAPTSTEATDTAATGPYSITKVSNDLAQTPTPIASKPNIQTTLALVVSAAAIVFSIFALLWRRRK